MGRDLHCPGGPTPGSPAAKKPPGPPLGILGTLESQLSMCLFVAHYLKVNTTGSCPSVTRPLCVLCHLWDSRKCVLGLGLGPSRRSQF